MGDEAVSKCDVGSPRVVELTSAQTHGLRLQVLRDGTPSPDLTWPGDDDITTVHLGVIISNSTDPVAISTWLRTRSPDMASGTGTQLRGMATDPMVRGLGVGSLLLRAGVDRARRGGADHVWANARVAVLDFYVAHGFEVTSDEFLSADTAIAHRRILQHLHSV